MKVKDALKILQQCNPEMDFMASPMRAVNDIDTAAAPHYMPDPETQFAIKEIIQSTSMIGEQKTTLIAGFDASMPVPGVFDEPEEFEN